MGDWNEVKTQEDIDFLMSTYRDFHDSVLISANYKNGYYVDDENAIHGCEPEDFVLSMLFHSQWQPRIVELQFMGLRQTHLTGWEDNYLPIILETYLAFHENLLPGSPSKVIIWSDNSWFDTEKIDNTIHEPSETYVVANSLRWRIIKE